MNRVRHLRLSKRQAVLAVAGSLGLTLLASTQVWVRGTTRDAVLGATQVSATGAQLAPGTTALALVVAAGVVALATGGPRIRYAAGALLVLAGLGMIGLHLPVLTDPAAALGGRAAQVAGRAGSTVRVDAALTPLSFVSLIGAIALVVSSSLGLVSARSWAGLSRRFDRSAGPGTPGPTGGQGARHTAWDELTDGVDPTLRDTGEPT